MEPAASTMLGAVYKITLSVLDLYRGGTLETASILVSCLDVKLLVALI